MHWRFCAGVFLLSVTLPFEAQANPIPATVENMIRAAADSGDPAVLKTTADLAKKTNPQSDTEIDALVAQLQSAAAERHREELRRQRLFDGWKGQGEAGASDSTGNTRSVNVSLGLALNRDGLRWRHALNATVDYQRDSGIESKDRYFASYEGNYKYDDRFYALGLLSWEGDRFSGFDSRFSEAIGFGYAVLKTDAMTLSLEAGPATRQTRYIDGNKENNVAGRAAVSYLWNVLPKLVFTEEAAFYDEGKDSTVTSNAAFTANLIGSLSARASFLVKYENNPPAGLDNTDTTSRVTLVYSF